MLSPFKRLLSSLAVRIIALVAIVQLFVFTSIFMVQEYQIRDLVQNFDLNTEFAYYTFLTAYQIEGSEGVYSPAPKYLRTQYMEAFQHISDNNPQFWLIHKWKGQDIIIGNPRMDTNSLTDFLEERKSVLPETSTPTVSGADSRASCELLYYQNTHSKNSAYYSIEECSDGYLSVTALGGLSENYVFPARYARLYLYTETQDVRPYLAILAASIVLTPAVIYLILAPMRRATRAVTKVTQYRQGQQLPASNLPAELNGLVGAINSALRRLDAGYERERRFRDAIAHEMRTPLTVLKGQLDDEPLATKAKNRLFDQIRKMELKINRLLQFARVTAESNKLERLNLVKEVRNACVECDVTAVREGVEIQLDAEAHQIFVDATPTAIMLAVMNVLNNAIFHSQSQQPIEVKVFETGKVTIRDHGKGIPDEIKETLFTPNSERPQNGRSQGRGLGLVISSEVMGFSRGTISVSDAEGGGTIFALQFKPST